MNHKTYFLIFYLIKCILLIEYNSFTNQCGPNKDLEKSISKKEDCTNSKDDSGQLCCFLEGEQDLVYKSCCILIPENTTKNRVAVIKNMTEVATKLKIDCGGVKNFTSDCGKKKENPSSVKDCKEFESEQCCFVKIKSNDFEGTACRKFNDMTRTKIGQSVIAAKTIGATLEISCYSEKFFDINNFLLIIYILLLLL